MTPTLWATCDCHPNDPVKVATRDDRTRLERMAVFMDAQIGAGMGPAGCDVVLAIHDDTDTPEKT